MSAITVFMTVISYMHELRTKNKSAAYRTLANAVPLRTLYRTYCMALLLLSACRAEGADVYALTSTAHFMRVSLVKQSFLWGGQS